MGKDGRLSGRSVSKRGSLLATEVRQLNLSDSASFADRLR